MQRAFRRRLPIWGGLLGLAMANAVHAGAALRSEAEILYSVAVGHNWATQTWDDHGDARDIGCRNRYSGLSNYLEYGYSYYYTLFGSVGLAKSACDFEDETGLSDLRLGLRGRVNRYLNTRGWEVVATIPLGGRQIGRSRIGCGAFGLAGNLDRKDKLVEDWLSLGYGTSLRLWERPLAHEARGEFEFSGRIRGRLQWNAGMDHAFPLSDPVPDPDAAASDCGTNAQAVKASTGIKYGLDDDRSIACGYARAVWGEDTSRGQGLFCGYTQIWR